MSGFPRPAQVEGELGCCCVFPEPEADQHDDGRRCLGLFEARLPAAERLDELLVYDVDDVLHRGKARENLRPKRTLFDTGDEFADDFVVDVRLKESETDFAQRVFEILFADRAAPAQAPEDSLEFIGEGVKHIYKERLYE
jgi:hypothetical protein